MTEQTERKIPVHAAAEISVDPNYTTAFMTISAPQNGGTEMTFEKAIAALQGKNVSYGINENSVRKLVESKHYDESVCVARFTPPENGENGDIRYLFSTDNTLAPVENEDGTVDFRNLGLVRNITRGTVIAEITLPTEGTPGKDLMGRPVPQKKGVPATYGVGKGTELTDEGTRIIASIDGNLRFDGGKFIVDEELVIGDDIDVSIGNIDFIGNVTIRGSVSEGFSVTSKKNIVVNGLVVGATLTADGSITVRTGCVNAKVQATGEIRMGFCENSVVRSDTYVESGSFIGGEVYSGGKINATAKGIMVGGKYTALDDIEAGTIGSESYVRTLVTVGNNAILSEERDTLQRTIPELEGKLDGMNKILEALTAFAKTAKLSPEREQMRTDVIRSKLKVQQEIRKASNRIERINEALMVQQTFTVSVRKAFFPGVTLRINDCLTNINTPLSRCKATIDNAEITFKPLM